MTITATTYRRGVDYHGRIIVRGEIRLVIASPIRRLSRGDALQDAQMMAADYCREHARQAWTTADRQEPRS
jgi:hypothetical protein